MPTCALLFLLYSWGSRFGVPNPLPLLPGSLLWSSKFPVSVVHVSFVAIKPSNEDPWVFDVPCAFHVTRLQPHVVLVNTIDLRWRPVARYYTVGASVITHLVVRVA